MTSSTAARARTAPDRTALSGARRIVVKVGSSSLTSIRGGISEEALTDLADALAHKRNAGTEIILVSSGAIAAGLAPLGLEKRPRDLATQQAAASVGQGLLMARYTHAFGAHGVTVSQVLLTADDLMRRSQHTNAFRALDRLLNLGVVPGGQRKRHRGHARDPLWRQRPARRPRGAPGPRRRARAALRRRLPLRRPARRTAPGGSPHVTGPHDLDGVSIGSTGKAGVGTGGMVTKVEAATIAAGSGIHALVTSTANAAAALAGEDVGTWFSVNGSRKPIRLLWLAHLASVHGTLVLDDGAVQAVRDRRTSLLPAGIAAVKGHFEAGRRRGDGRHPTAR